MSGMLKFVKMHGLGNDYVVIDLFDSKNRKAFEKIKDLKSFTKKVCNRHFSIGADGILLASPSKKVDGEMRIINADGSEAEMCGNGIRCIAKFVIDNGYSNSNAIKIKTISGVKTIVAKDGIYRVDMGEPRLLRREIPMNGKADAKAINEPLQLKYKQVKVTAVSMGNPHAIMFVNDTDFDIDNFDIEEMGKEIENHPVFPRRTNAEFAHVLNKGEIELRVWERGVGETLACGTGACATLVASVLNDKTDRKVKIHVRGGDLLVEWAKDNHVYITGPATYVFSGAIVV